MAEWTDEIKAEVIEKYEAANPTPETSTEIVADLAEEYGFTPNGVRAILVRAEVYVKKTPASGGGNGEKKAAGGKRINKAEAIDELRGLIEAAQVEVDDDIINRLTGKAAKYFSEVFIKIQEPLG